VTNGELDWLAVREAYEATSEPRHLICHRFGISSWQLSDRAATDGWMLRRPGTKGTYDQRRRMIERLFKTLEAKLSSLEERMATQGSGTSADADREARDLSAIVRNFEKVADADDKLKRRIKRRRPETVAADSDRIRDEIAQRLARLVGAQGDLGPAPGEPRA